eukprot:jgi/Chrzof1/6370/Cz18g06030.t1
MPSYRDAECKNTLVELFRKAEHPQRIFVGSTEQRANATEGCIPPNFAHEKQVRLVNLPLTVQEGHTYSRYICSQLYAGEDYFMQIDAHSKFKPHWDTRYIDMLHRCPSKRPLLTHYPFDYDQFDVNQTLVPIMCTGKFNDRGMFAFNTQVLPASKMGLGPVPFVAGGFIFTLGRILRDVPYDPNLPFLWEGEEFLYSARWWTHGYDFFTPDANIIFHQYNHNKLGRASVWSDAPNWYKRMMGSEAKYYYLFGMKPVPQNSSYELKQELMKYGMGKQRTLQQYLNFSGVDVHNKVIKSEQLFCPDAVTKAPPPTTQPPQQRNATSAAALGAAAGAAKAVANKLPRRLH